MTEVRNKNDFNEYIESLLVNYESDDLDLKVPQGAFLAHFGTLIPPSPIARAE